MTDIEKISSETQEAMRRKSAANLPDSPRDHGYTPQQIKAALVRLILDNKESIVAEINRIVEESNAVVGEKLNASEISSWAKAPVKPTYTAAEVGALPAGTKIPHKTSDIINDSGFITALVSNLANYYTKDSVYTKAEIDSAIPTDNASLLNGAGYVGKNVSDLANYYLKTETMTKSEINALIASLSKIEFRKVDSLPEVGEAGIIYIVPAENTVDNNKYDEFFWQDGGWEYIGDTSVDVKSLVEDALRQAQQSGSFNGANGITPHIGSNGNWFIGDEDTGKPSRGATGATGADGKSAYEYAQDGGFTGTESQFNKGLSVMGGVSGIDTTVTQNSGNLITSGAVYEYVTSTINPTRHYGARWNKTQAQMTRLYDAESFPTDTKNFGHFGSVNANYSNPFDSIYPWSGIRLCNIDLNLYANLAAGDSITKCVKAWEGDVDFSYNDANGVWRYRPEFWGKSWEDDTYRYFDVSEKAIDSYVHYPEAIVGRWHGRAVTLTVGEAEKTCLVPSVGMPANSIAISTLHTYAKNYGATIDSIYSVDADTLLCVVEFATMNTQNAIGNGVSSLYRQSSDLIQEDATNSTTVKVLAAAGRAYCIPGAIFDIGTSNGGTQVGSFVVVSATPNVGDAQYLDVTLDQAVTVTSANYWSVHGLVNVADEGIGSKSGYIGTNGKCNAYYRGVVMFGNMWFYILGAYENKDDHHIWIANSDEEADNSDALDTTVHYDTGLVLPTAGGYTKKLGLLSRSGLLSIPAFCVETGGDSSNPVGDYFYNGLYTYNTVLLRGGGASNGSNGGAFYCYWSDEASSGDWYISAHPRLKNP